MKNKILNVLFGDGTMKRWISITLIILGIINITLSLYNPNEEDVTIFIGFGIFLLALGIGGYFNPPKNNNI
jgi:uncharacterized membrane protein HdeD (DUF308 family)